MILLVIFFLNVELVDKDHIVQHNYKINTYRKTLISLILYLRTIVFTTKIQLFYNL